ncbi:MAG: hypothetical protein IPM52_05820 [Bacteroidetes bacterium]|nr:hypothetical protein [Bacteroidota bacterium]
MKTQNAKSLMIFFLAFGLLLTACKKDETDPTQLSVGQMTAKIDGKKWNASSGMMGTTLATYAASILTISGTEISGTKTTTIQLIVSNVTGTGDYTLGSELSGQGLLSIADATNLADQKAYGTTGEGEFTGTLKITKFDLENKEIAGTFSFTALEGEQKASGEKKVVTDGAFNLKMQN